MSTPVYALPQEVFHPVSAESFTPVSVVVPAYNEADRIAPTLDALHVSLDAHFPRQYELLVVDDGSTDRTAYVAREMGARVLGLGNNQGKGAALRNGMTLAQGSEARAFCDADGSIDAPSVIRLLDIVLDGGADIAIATRRTGGAEQHESYVRHLGSHGLASLCEKILPTGISDTQCGGKAFRAAIATELFGKSVGTGYALDREILARARRTGATVHEVPVEVIPREGSHVRPIRDGLRMIKETLRTRASI